MPPSILLIGILKIMLTILTTIVPIIKIMAPCTNPCFCLVSLTHTPTF